MNNIDKVNKHVYDHDYESMWDEHYNAIFESRKNQIKNNFLDGKITLQDIVDLNPYDR